MRLDKLIDVLGTDLTFLPKKNKNKNPELWNFKNFSHRMRQLECKHAASLQIKVEFRNLWESFIHSPNCQAPSSLPSPPSTLAGSPIWPLRLSMDLLFHSSPSPAFLWGDVSKCFPKLIYWCLIYAHTGPTPGMAMAWLKEMVIWATLPVMEIFCLSFPPL